MRKKESIMKKQLLFASLLTLFARPAYSMNLPAVDEQEEEAWDPEEYEKNSRGQLGAGKIMLAECPIPEGVTVVDLGCGIGNLAAHITTELGHDGFVIGVDNDARMIDYAKTKHESLFHLTFQKLNATNLSGIDDGSIGYFISIYCLSWVKTLDEMKMIMKEVARCLQPGGQFIARFTINHSAERNIPYLHAIDDVVTQDKWSHYYKGNVPLVNRLDIKDYEAALQEAGLQGEVTTVKLASFKLEREKLGQGLMSLPTGKLIPANRREEFFDEIREALSNYAEKDADGNFVLAGNPCVIKAFKPIL